MENECLMWQFNTRNYSVRWYISPCCDVDLSWDNDGSIRAGLEDGTLTAFNNHLVVLKNGTLIGEDYLCESIYENPQDFRGPRAERGTYFADMVRAAIDNARLNTKEWS